MKKYTTSAETGKESRSLALEKAVAMKSSDLIVSTTRNWLEVFAKSSPLNREFSRSSLAELDNPRTRLMLYLIRLSRRGSAEKVTDRFSTLVIRGNKDHHTLKGTHRRLPREKNLTKYQKVMMMAPAAARVPDRELSFFTLTLSNSKLAELGNCPKALREMFKAVTTELNKAVTPVAGKPEVLMVMETTAAGFIHFHGLLLSSDNLHTKCRKMKNNYLSALKRAGGEDWRAPLKKDGKPNPGYHQAEIVKLKGELKFHYECNAINVANYLMKQGHNYSATNGFKALGNELYGDLRDMLTTAYELADTIMKRSDGKAATETVRKTTSLIPASDCKPVCSYDDRKPVKAERMAQEGTEKASASTTPPRDSEQPILPDKLRAKIVSVKRITPLTQLQRD